MRRALLIGNQEYKKLDKLNLPIADMETLKIILTNIGFRCNEGNCLDSDKIKYEYTDLTYDYMIGVIDAFSKSINNGDEVIIYFSGHGYAYNGENYLACIDAEHFRDINGVTVMAEGYDKVAKVTPMNYLIEKLSHNNEGKNILLLDACREVYTERLFNDESLKRHRLSGFVESKSVPSNFFISYATALGSCSHEIEGEKNSVYMTGLSKFIYRPMQTLQELFECISNYVVNNYNSQIPCVYSTLIDSYILIDNNNLCIDSEKKRIQDIKEVYEHFYNEIVNDSSDFMKEKMVQRLLKSAEGLLYMSKRQLNEYIKHILIAYEEKLGIIYLLLLNEDIKRIDVFEDKLIIENRLGEGCCIENIGYYNFSECENFFKRYKISDDKGIEIISYYKGKTVLLYKECIRPKKYFQICETIRDKDVNELIGFWNNKIVKDNIGEEIEDLIVSSVRDNKNILLVGDIHTDKEEYVSAMSRYFKEEDYILNFSDDVVVKTYRGNSNLIMIEKLIEHRENLVSNINTNNISRLILSIKAHRSSEKKLFKDILKIRANQYILLYDMGSDFFKFDLENGCLDKTVELDLLSIDVIILFNKCYGVGTYIDSIFERSGKKFVKSIEIKINHDLIPTRD